MIGPLAKIDWSELPQRVNIHYLGPKSYEELPAYIANWDGAMIAVRNTTVDAHEPLTSSPAKPAPLIVWPWFAASIATKSILDPSFKR